MSKPYTELDALVEVGAWKPIDLVAVSLFGISFTASVLCMAFGWAPAHKVVLCVLFALIFLLLWLISLVYRTMFFIVKVWADIKGLPADAARLAVSFVQQPPQDKSAPLATAMNNQHERAR